MSSDGNYGGVQCPLMVFSLLDCRLRLTQEDCAGCLGITTR